MLVSLPTQECRDVKIVSIALLGVTVSDIIAAVTDNRRAFKTLVVNVIITAALDQRELRVSHRVHHAVQ